MLRLLADENFNNHILKGLRRQLSEVDFLRVQDLEISGADDRTVLEWAANHDRILLTHDVKTIRFFVEERFHQGLAVPGVVFVSQPFSVAEVIGDLVLVVECSSSDEMSDRIYTYLPLP